MPRRLQFGDDNSSQPTTTATPSPSVGFAPQVAPQLPAVAPTPVAAPPPANIPELRNATPGKPPITMEEVGQIGSNAQAQIAQVTSKITGVAKTSDMDAMGKLLTDTIMAAKGYDPNNLFKGRLFGFMKAKGNQIQLRFDTVDQTWTGWFSRWTRRSALPSARPRPRSHARCERAVSQRTDPANRKGHPDCRLDGRRTRPPWTRTTR
jgi:hypothetical protein